MTKITVSNIECLLLDIEGTTTSISFVKDTLFPCVRQNLENYIKDHWGEEHLAEDIEALRKQAEDDALQGMEGVVLIMPLSELASEDETAKVQKAVVANVLWQMDADRKTTALKQLQGHIWHSSYCKGEIKAHIFEDVPPALERWHKDGKVVYIYSSGSVQAQKLLFNHTMYGSLLQYINGYFDTKTGPKLEAQSYKKIAMSIGQEPQNILFLTDIPKEAIAAKEAGLKTFIVLREGNAPLSENDRIMFQHITSFADFEMLA